MHIDNTPVPYPWSLQVWTLWSSVSSDFLFQLCPCPSFPFFYHFLIFQNSSFIGHLDGLMTSMDGHLRLPARTHHSLQSRPVSLTVWYFLDYQESFSFKLPFLTLFQFPLFLQVYFFNIWFLWSSDIDFQILTFDQVSNVFLNYIMGPYSNIVRQKTLDSWSKVKRENQRCQKEQYNDKSQ